MGFTVEDPTTVLHLSSLTPEKSTSCTPGRDHSYATEVGQGNTKHQEALDCQIYEFRVVIHVLSNLERRINQ